VSDSTGSWQPDPHGRHQYRYWDGTQWTDQVADDGVSAVDPPDAAGAPAPGGDAPAVEAPADPTPTEPTTSLDPAQPVDPGATSWGAPPTDPGATTSMPVDAGAVPPAAATVDAPKKSSGNKPALIIGGVLLLALIGAGAWLLLGGGDDDDDLRADVISDLTEDGDMTDEQANCFVDEVEDEIGMEEIRTIDESDGENLSTSQMSAIISAATECGLDGFDGSGSQAGGAGDAGGAGGIDTGDPIVDLLVQGLVQGANLSQEDAQCVSEALVGNDDFDLADLGQNPEAAASSDLMRVLLDAFDDCDLDLSTLGGGATGTSGDPDTYGDDATLDALWDSCDDGDMGACDDLFFQSPFGSE
jgi:polyhydroxyalkanoate synthesis regulator phasin